MNNNILAIIVAFYLSKFNQEGVGNLGFNSFNEVFDKTADLLNVKRNYVKLRRDELIRFIHGGKDGKDQWTKELSERLKF